MPPSASFIAYEVKPGDACKIAMPGCSALEIKHAALASGSSSNARCTLECDLATHSFVLCSLPPGGRMQASLGTVVTNDPNETAWLFLKATGPCAFHVLGRLVIDRPTEDRRAAKRRVPSKLSAPVSVGIGTGDGASDDEGWPSAADIAPSAATKRSRVDDAPATAPDAASDEGENIEVLLPAGDDSIEFEHAAEEVSDADSEDFVQVMTMHSKNPWSWRMATRTLFALSAQPWLTDPWIRSCVCLCACSG